MALKTKVGSFNAFTTTGTQTVTGIGFTPKALILFSQNQPNSAGMVLGMGHSTANSWSITAYDQDAQGTSNCAARVSTDIYTPATATVVDTCSLVGFASDQFQLSWTNAASSAYEIFYVAFGSDTGDGIDFFVGNDTTRSTAGVKAYTGAGWTPSCVFLVGANRGARNSTGSEDSSVGLGFISSFLTGYHASTQAKDNATVSITNSASGIGYCLRILDDDGSSDLVAAVPQSLDADGFSLNFAVASSTVRYFSYLCIKGVRATVNSSTALTSPGSSTVDLGYDAKCTLAISADGGGGAGELSFGASDGVNSRAVWYGSEHNNTTTNAKSQQSNSNAYIDYDTITNTVESAATHTTTPGRLSFNYSSATNNRTRNVYSLVLSTQNQATALGGLTTGGAATCRQIWTATGSGGLTLSGTTTVKANYVAAATGGLTLSSSSPAKVISPYTASGGLVLDGTAPAAINLPYTASGSLTLSGAADASYEEASQDYEYEASGSIALDGTAEASYSPSYVETGSGGIELSGEGQADLRLSYEGSGDIVLDGSAESSYSPAYVEQGSGGINLDGTADVALRLSLYAQGGIELGGEADSSYDATLRYVATGGINLGGQGDSSYSPRYVESGSGQITFGGQANVSGRYDYRATGEGQVTLGGQADCRLVGDTAYDYVASGGLILGGRAFAEVRFKTAKIRRLVVSPQIAAKTTVGAAMTAAVEVSPSVEAQASVSPAFVADTTIGPNYTSEG